MAFQVFTDTSSGITKELRDKYHIEYFQMRLIVNGVEHPADLDYQDFSRDEMYDWVRDQGVEIKTSLVPAEEYISKSEAYLKKGIDVLYVACADALSGSRGVFELIKEDLQKKYPDRKIASVNSCRAEMALGLLAIEAAKMGKEGKDFDEVVKWLEDNKQYYHEVGSVDTLKYLRAYGRVGGAAAFFADTFNIKPVIAFDVRGMNTSFKKVHGAKKAMEECFDYIKKHMVEGKTDIVYLGMTTPIPAYDYLQKRIEEELKIKVEKYYIGPIVGICCGPGMYGCWFRGDLVTLGAEDK